jgi:hypothetical protein
MKRNHLSKAVFAVFVLLSFSSNAQKNYGSTLNLGLGLGGNYGYYSYVGSSFPMLHVDYEFDVAKNFTVAPLVNLYSYSRPYNWKSKDYYYRESAVQLGAKATYYFDELLQAGSKWDFYLAGSLGFTFVKGVWEDGYGGNTGIYTRSSPLYLDLHIGSEYHFNSKVGMFLDLSTGVNTIGVAIHK